MTLGKMRSKAAIPALVESMKDENDWVRRTAAQIVGAMRTVGGAADSAIPAVLELLKDEDATIRKNAIVALWLLGPQAKPAVAALLESFKDGNKEVRLAAARALAMIDPENKEAVSALASYMLRDENAKFVALLLEPCRNSVVKPRLPCLRL